MADHMGTILKRLNDLYNNLSNLEADVLVDTEGKFGPWFC